MSNFIKAKQGGVKEEINSCKEVFQHIYFTLLKKCGRMFDIMSIPSWCK